MNLREEYIEDARKHEKVFRNILRGLPADLRRYTGLDPEAPLDKIYERFSTGERHGIWTILDFRMGPNNEDPLAPLAEHEAMFAHEDIACLSGFGSMQKYKVNPDNSVEFVSDFISWMS